MFALFNFIHSLLVIMEMTYFLFNQDIEPQLDLQLECRNPVVTVAHPSQVNSGGLEASLQLSSIRSRMGFKRVFRAVSEILCQSSSLIRTTPGHFGGRSALMMDVTGKRRAEQECSGPHWWMYLIPLKKGLYGKRMRYCSWELLCWVIVAAASV